MDHQQPDMPPEHGSGETPARANALRRYRAHLLAGVFAVGIAALLVLAHHLLTTPETADATPNATSAHTADDAEDPAMRAEAAPPGFVYEEPARGELEERVKQADYALLETLQDLGLGPDRLDLEDVEVRREADGDYHYQRLALALNGSGERFLETLGLRLGARVPEAELDRNATAAGPDGTVLAAIRIRGVPTHSLRLTPKPEPAPEPKRPAPAPEDAPLLAIVIDDMGEDMGFARGLAALPFRACFSVWPNASHAAETIRLARKAGNELLVHLPMQPRGWPDVDPGPEALFTDMTAEQIRATVRSNLDKVHGAAGVNNHMGSRFTEYGPGMAAALAVIKGDGLYFLDSMTTGKSAGRGAAARVGIPFYERDIFLDNVKDVTAILHQLNKATAVARQRGWAIAIGHPHRTTLEALRRWSRSGAGKVRVVPVSSLPPVSS